MKGATSVVLVVCLVATSVATHAQPGSAAVSNWGRVRTIVPGTRISVGVAAPEEVQQYFLDATDDTITLLDLTNRDIPRDARRAVIRIAERQPRLFTSTRWIEATTDGRVRVNQDGVFVKHRRVAALEDLVKTLDRGDVGEVSRLARVRHPRSRDPEAPPMPLMYGGALLASAVAAACSEHCGNVGGLFLFLGTLFGPAIAWTVLHQQHAHMTEVVYRAP